ncbi:hypothetical protein BJX99DRAFT_268439 [Aspergillus californicus]
MLPKPHLTPDSFFHETSSQQPFPSQSPWPVTIYFITGNPGLISYYHAFLSSLADRLVPGSHPSSASDRKSGVKSRYHIFGHSLAGFELDGLNATSKSGFSGGGKQVHQEGYPYSLEDQICYVQRKLQAHMSSLRAEYPTPGELDRSDSTSKSRLPARPKVILIGHSVGAYIAMEVLRRHRENQQQYTKAGSKAAADGFEITGGIMLFPTVMDIAKSPSGQKLTLLLKTIPQLAIVVSFFARLLTMILPNVVLRAVVRAVMRSPPDAAVDTTSAFLKSRCGVRQAIHMAADEMMTISTDKWSDDVWGISSPKAAESLTRLFFYFGRNDHWIAEQTREDIVALRGWTKTGPKMIVCEESVPHAFCLRHNETMAAKVADMIRNIIEVE